MTNEFPPRKDADLLQMAQDFSTKVTDAPTDWGYTSSQATQTAAAVASYASAYQAANDPATRTKAKIAAKKTARISLVNNLRMMNRVAQSNPALSDEQKI